MSDQERVEQWIKKIDAAEKHYEEYHTLIKDIRKYYKNGSKKNKHNIFWASVETLKPFLYFKQPTPYIDRKEKAVNPVASVACRILEKALAWDLEQQDFDGVLKYVRNDYLLSGMGLAYEKYEPTFKKVMKTVAVATPMGEVVVGEEEVEILDSEKVKTVYIDPEDFIADSEKVGIWEDCTWFASKIHMTRQEVVDQFGEDVEQYLIVDDDKEKEGKKSCVVYEIWDKTSKKVLYLTKDCKVRFLKEIDDVFGVEGFFTMPKPIFGTQTNDDIVPVPDYTQIKEQLEELDGITSRMKLTMQALKVSGCYDNSFPELNNILSKDVTLVSVSDFDKLKQAGGIKNIIDFMPIEQYIQALTSLAERRQDLIAQIYEITGVSDIMRGNSDPNETATAVTKKTNFGTLRNQDRQNDMQRFITDLFKIKAEIICERFSEETLSQFAEENTDINLVMQAIQLLKADKLRGMTLGIETDTSFEQDGDGQKVNDAITLIHTMITNAFQAVSAQPLLLPLYRKMVETVVISFPNARQYEPVIEQVFDGIQQQLSAPEPEQPNPEMMKVQAQQQKNQQDFAIKQEQNKIKQDELLLKKQIEDNKLMLTNKEMELQAELKQEEIAQKGFTNENISTGYVRGF